MSPVPQTINAFIVKMVHTYMEEPAIPPVPLALLPTSKHTNVYLVIVLAELALIIQVNVPVALLEKAISKLVILQASV